MVRGDIIGVREFVAAMADKDIDGMLRELEPVVDVVVCTRNASSRSLAARLPYDSQPSTMSWFSSIHLVAASSGDMPSSAM